MRDVRLLAVRVCSTSLVREENRTVTLFPQNPRLNHPRDDYVIPFSAGNLQVLLKFLCTGDTSVSSRRNRSESEIIYTYV